MSMGIITRGNNMADDQETYLSSTSFGKICQRGAKKLITELSSVKSLAMLAIVGLNYFGKLDSYATIIGLLGLVGAKEIDINQVITIIQSKFGGGGK
jgi:hypothetical protein